MRFGVVSCLFILHKIGQYRGRMPLSVIEEEHLLVEGGDVCLTVVDTNS